MNILMSELFDKINKAPSKQEKLNILRAHGNEPVWNMFRINYNPDIKMLLPEGRPPYRRVTDIPVGYNEATLFLENRRLYIWFDPNVNIARTKKEALFIELLESIHYTEADILLACKERELETIYPALTRELINEAFPGLLPPAPVKEKPAKKAKKVAASNQ